LFDARPFFEKALLFGVQHGIITAKALDAMRTEAPRAWCRSRGTLAPSSCAPSWKKQKHRMVNLVSLYLENASGGDLARAAAELLRDHSLLSRSKGGLGHAQGLDHHAAEQPLRHARGHPLALPTSTFRCWPSGHSGIWRIIQLSWPSAIRWHK
jgi:hypothetical protein